MITIALESAQSLLLEVRGNGQSLGTATGFLVKEKDRTFLITNRHVVTGRDQNTGKPIHPSCGIPDEVLIYQNKLRHLAHKVLKRESLFLFDSPRWFEHPALGHRADVVALELTDTNDVEVYDYSLEDLGPDIFLAPSVMVSVVGFPFGLAVGETLAVWSTGFIASDIEVDYMDLPVFLIDCRARKGQSGSPVVAYRAGGPVPLRNSATATYPGPVRKFLGIYSGRINAESDLGMVWKPDVIREIVRGVGV